LPELSVPSLQSYGSMRSRCILTAQKLMGHSTLEATMLYVHNQGGAKKVMKLLAIA